jgi:hypothetical protein
MIRAPHAAQTTDAVDRGGGTGCPIARRVSMWPRIASRMSWSASSLESPEDTQPGRSGTHTLNEPSSAGSMTTVYCTGQSYQPRVSEDRLERAGGYIASGLSARGDRDQQGLLRVFEVEVAARGADVHRAVFFPRRAIRSRYFMWKATRCAPRGCCVREARPATLAAWGERAGRRGKAERAA